MLIRKKINQLINKIIGILPLKYKTNKKLVKLINTYYYLF